MNPPTVGEVLEALKRLRERTTYLLYLEAEEAHESQLAAREHAALCRDLATLALLEKKYATEMVQREQEEAAGERKVRPVFTAEEARQLCSLASKSESAANTLDAALKALEPEKP